MEKEKIAFIIHSLEVGGSEKFMIFIANEFYKRGYMPVVISLSDNNPLLNELNNRIPFVTIKRAFRLDISISGRIKKVIQQKKITKVFCVGAYSFFFSKLFLMFDRKIRFFLSLHTTQPKSIKAYIRQLFFLQAVSKRDQVVFISCNQRNYYHQKYFVSRHHNTVIINGICMDYFNPKIMDCDSEQLRGKNRYRKSNKILLMVATIRPEKGHYDAITALKILRNKYLQYDARLLFVGGGNAQYINKLKKYSFEKGLHQYIAFQGNISDVRPFYFMADIFTLTSWSETFSLAALEALAFGLPCSLTNIGGATEMVIEGKTGTLSKPRNPESIAQSWDKLLRHKFNKDQIRQFAMERYDIDRMFEDYYSLIMGN